MTNIIHIIETDTIRTGDLVAFEFGKNEITGIVCGMDDRGDFIVSTSAGKVVVGHDKITDIC